MATLLNIETSTEVCSVVLSQNGVSICEKESTEGLNHSRLLSVFVEDIFKELNFDIDSIDAVAVSKGPGSYTGLRIGVSFAKGLCYSIGNPLISVGALEAMVIHTLQNVDRYLSNETKSSKILFCPMIDARRMEVYTTLYNIKGKQLEPVTAKTIDENSFSDYLNEYTVLFFGNGSSKCKSEIIHPNALFLGPVKTSARFMITIAEEKYKKMEFEDVAYFEPLYLKDFIATIPGKKF